MKNTTVLFVAALSLLLSSCNLFGDRPDREVEIPLFNFPETTVWEQNLSAYNIFDGTPADLTPTSDFHLIELSSVLYTDYAYKQRLVKVPAGTKLGRSGNGLADFPDGTMLTKTFYYQNDERDPSFGRRIIETRLLIKENSTWNIATYRWNDAQTEATLALDGSDTQVTWIAADGTQQSTMYHVPSQNECVTCHQINSLMTPIGPKLRNMNRTVERNGTSLNQLAYLQSQGVLEEFDHTQVSQVVDYKDTSIPLAERGRAYLEINCAHCHNPNGWDAPAERDFDFRYETPFGQTGIEFGTDEITEVMVNEEMPFIGTTLIDQEGVQLIMAYMESL